MRNGLPAGVYKVGCGHICAARRDVWGAGKLAPFKGGGDDERADSGVLCKGARELKTRRKTHCLDEGARQKGRRPSCAF